MSSIDYSSHPFKIFPLLSQSNINWDSLSPLVECVSTGASFIKHRCVVNRVKVQSIVHPCSYVNTHASMLQSYGPRGHFYNVNCGCRWQWVLSKQWSVNGHLHVYVLGRAGASNGCITKITDASSSNEPTCFSPFIWILNIHSYQGWRELKNKYESDTHH